MKLIVLTVFSLNFCVMLFSQNNTPVIPDISLPNEGYRVKGHLVNAQGKKIFLIENDFFKEANFKDSAIADAGGDFEFVGKLAEPAFCSLEIDGINANFEFILENSVVKISGNADKIYAATIEGSKEEDVRKVYNAFWNSDSLRTVFGNLEKLKTEAEAKQDTVAINSVDLQLKKAISNNNAVIEELIKNIPT